MGKQGYDPLDICELDSDTSSNEDDYVVLKGNNQDTSFEEYDGEERTKAKKGGRMETPSKRGKKGMLVTSDDLEYVPLLPPGPQPGHMTDSDKTLAATAATDRTAMNSSVGDTSDGPLVFMNWTSPAQRQKAKEWRDFEAMVSAMEDDGKKPMTPLVKQKAYSKMMATSHISEMGLPISKLLCAETKEEIDMIFSGQELKRQRSAIPHGPLHVYARFGCCALPDLAAIDSGATQNFVSKSWLYSYLQQGGDMKVLSFEAQGHETFDGTVFYTYGVVRIPVFMDFGEGNTKELVLEANVTKDATAMYSVVLGTTFLGTNRVFVADSLGMLFLAEDLPDGIRAKGQQIKVNWERPVKDVFASEDIYLSPGTKIRTNAELQDIVKKKKKQRKQSLVDACVADVEANYAFVPKPAKEWSLVVNATTLVHPSSRDSDINDIARRGYKETLNFDGNPVVLNSSFMRQHTELDYTSSDSDADSRCSACTGTAAEEVFYDTDDTAASDNWTKSPRNGFFEQREKSEKQSDGRSHVHFADDPKPTFKAGFQVPVELANFGDEPAVIRKGTFLDQLHEIREAEVDVDVALGKDVEATRSRYTDGELDTLFGTLKIDELQVDEKHKDSLRKIIAQYANVFAKTKEEVGQVSIMRVAIDVQGNLPRRVKPYRVSPKERMIIKEEVEKMLRSGVIEPSTSEWASPVVLVPKPDGSTRFAIDFRKLNEITRKEVYPMPHIQDYLDVLRGNEYFTIADGQQAYFGLPMDEDSKPMTAFICHLGQYQFLKMPFGLCNAPAIYQRLMNSVLQGMLWEECLVYLDDICLMSATVEEHLERLERLFKRLVAAGIVLKPSKTHLLQRSIKLLGHIIDKDGTRPVGAKVKSINEFQVTTRAELHTFLGMCGYYSHYCKDYAEITIPLRKLLHGKGPFKMEQEHADAIAALKKVLKSEPLLAHPDWDLPFEVHCDASNYAIGVVLCQVIDGKERVVGYYSRLMRDAEKKYDVTQKECLAVVWAAKKLRPYLYGRPFIVRTDHAALKWLLNLKDHTGRLMRWSVLLQDYTFVIEHRAGKANANADALSRLIQLSCLESQGQADPMGRMCTSIMNIILRSRTRKQKADESRSQFESTAFQPAEIDHAKKGAPPVNLPSKGTEPSLLKERHGVVVIGEKESLDAYSEVHKIIEREQRNDSVIKRLFDHFTREDRMDYVDWNKNRYRIINGLIHLVTKPKVGRDEEQERLLVPDSLQQEFIRLHHDHPTAGHFGSIKTLKRLQQRYMWPHMRANVEDYVKNCHACQRNNHKEMSHAAPRPIVPTGPYDIISLDCLRLPESIHGNAWVMVAIDHFTKYANTYVLRGSPSTQNIIKALTKFLSQHSMVRTFRCDRGIEFTNKYFTEACDKLMIKIQHTPTDHHRANGLSERFNRTLQNSLCKVLDETVSVDFWEEYIDWVTLAYNTSFHPSIQDTPFFMIYGRHAILPGDMWMFHKVLVNEEGSPINVSQYKSDMITRFAHTYSRARAYLYKHYDKMIEDANKLEPMTFEVGQEVYVYQPEAQQRDGIRKKLTYQWHGPLVIAEQHPDTPVLYRVYTENRDKKVQGWFHVNRLKLYRNLRPKVSQDDNLLPVPSYELEYEDLPISSQLIERLMVDYEERPDKRRRIGEEDDRDHEENYDPLFELIQHPKRKPTNVEMALIGKVFLDQGKRYKVFHVSYHQEKSVMVAHYKELIRKGTRWVDTGDSHCSSIPEIAYWIEKSAGDLYGRTTG